jgi:hypothetical protein
MKRWLIRLIAAGLVISWIFDLIWIVIHTSSWWHEVNYDGNLELGMRRFTIIVTFISFFFRIIVFLVFWKISVDFKRLFKSQAQETETRSFIDKNTTPSREMSHLEKL